METENYQVDKLAIVQEQESRAIEKVAEIEKRCDVSTVSFVKSNYGFVKLRNRKTEPEIGVLIGIAMTKVAVLLGLKGIDDLNKPDIRNAILNQYSDLTLEEIYKAFELERYNVYESKTEHYQLFNAEYVTSILKKYRVYKNNIQIQQNITPEQKESAKIDDEEKENIMKNAVNRVFQEFIETQNIEGITEYIFDFLVEKGKIKTKGTEALVLYYQTKLEEAKLQLKKETETADAKSPAEKKQFKIDLERIVTGQSGKILIRAKRNILFEYFNKQIQLNQQTIF